MFWTISKLSGVNGTPENSLEQEIFEVKTTPFSCLQRCRLWNSIPNISLIFLYPCLKLLVCLLKAIWQGKQRSGICNICLMHTKENLMICNMCYESRKENVKPDCRLSRQVMQFIKLWLLWWLLEHRVQFWTRNPINKYHRMNWIHLQHHN